jgi:transposase
MERKAYPSDVRDDEWVLVAPYLTLMAAEAPQREHSLREVFNGLRWLRAGVFDAIGPERRAVLQRAQGRKAAPAAAIGERHTLQSPPDSGHQAGDDGASRRCSAKVHMAVDTRGPLLAWHVTAANEQDRRQVRAWAATVQEVTGDAVAVAVVAQGDTGGHAAQEAQAQPMPLEVVKLPEAKKGVVRRPRRWVVESSQL